MGKSHRLMLAFALLGSAACGRNPDLTNPNVIEANLPGMWSQTIDVPGSLTVMTLSVSDTTVSGAGTWVREAGPGGSLAVTGYVTGSHVVLEIALDDGEVLHFNATMPAIDVLSGSLFTTGDPVPATFTRIQQDPPQ